MPKIHNQKKTLDDLKKSGDYIPPTLLIEDALDDGSPVVIGLKTAIEDCSKKKKINISMNMAISLIDCIEPRVIELGHLIMVTHKDTTLQMNHLATMIANKYGYHLSVKGKTIIIPKKLFIP